MRVVIISLVIFLLFSLFSFVIPLEKVYGLYNCDPCTPIGSTTVGCIDYYQNPPVPNALCGNSNNFSPPTGQCLPCGGGPPPPTVPTPTVCVAPAAPVGLTPDNFIFSSGGNYTLSWQPVAGATSYAVRVDDESNPWCDPPATACYATTPACSGNSGDYCDDNVLLATFVHPTPIQQGASRKSYGWWVQAINSCGWSPSSLRARIFVDPILAGAPTPTPLITPARTIMLSILQILASQIVPTGVPLGGSINIPFCTTSLELMNWEDDPCILPYVPSPPVGDIVIPNVNFPWLIGR